MQLISVAQMKQIEKEADSAGVSYAEMMERAGRGVARFIQSKVQITDNPMILGLVGSGNNGGDALISLAILAWRGWRTAVYLVRPRAEGDPLVERLLSAGGKVVDARQDPGMEQLDAWLYEADIVLDGVLGTGFTLPLRPDVATILRHVANCPNLPLIVAVDCPSGVDCDSGEVVEEVIKADVTLCIQAVKQGLLRFPAFAYAGELQTIPLDLPSGLKTETEFQDCVATVSAVRQALPIRSLTAHKGSFGVVMAIAGSVNYTGAVRLACEAAYRSGAGLVTAAIPSPLFSALAGVMPEVTWLLLPHEMGVIAENAASLVISRLARVNTVLVGPGLGLEPTTAAFVQQLFIPRNPKGRKQIGFGGINKTTETSHPIRLPRMVIDADGLKLLVQVPDWKEHLPVNCVLTPHPGEMAILTGKKVAEIQDNRLETVRYWAKIWGQVVVLKGALTIVASPDGRTMTIPVATSALAKAGTGDVLAGMVAGLMAQGMDAFEAAWTGAWLHGQAGLLAAEEQGGTTSVLATDILVALPKVLAGSEK